MMKDEDINIPVSEDQLWENLKISNDFMFAKVMRNKELCKGILERLMEIRIDIEYSEEQKVIDIAKDSKSVRLDVYLSDDKGTVYNVEIQTASNKNLSKRTRYYQGMIDLNAIEKVLITVSYRRVLLFLSVHLMYLEKGYVNIPLRIYAGKIWNWF